MDDGRLLLLLLLLSIQLTPNAGWLAGWLAEWLASWLAGWLADWLAGCAVLLGGGGVCGGWRVCVCVSGGRGDVCWWW